MVESSRCRRPHVARAIMSDAPKYPSRREYRRRHLSWLVVGAFALASGVLGCRPDPPPAPVVASDVRCDACGQSISREGAEAHLSPEGLDIFICQKCLDRVRRGKPLSSPPARSLGKNSSRGKT